MSKGRAERHGGVSAPVGLLVFALICGLALLLFGGGGASPADRARELELGPRLQALSQGLQHAERSLTTQNYGACRETLLKVQTDLSRLLSEVHSAEKR